MSANPSKTGGKLDSVTGSAKETLGSLTGSTNLQQSGQEKHMKGETEYDQARAQGYAEGTGDRVVGAKDSVVGSLTGDKSQQAGGNVRKEKGATQQDVNRKI